MLKERILKYSGFIYEISGKHYYLGKWICKECSDTNATDCVFMYHMSRRQNEESQTRIYFQKIRAYSDFALEVPYNPAAIEQNLSALLESFSEKETEDLSRQVSFFEEDYLKYCGKELP